MESVRNELNEAHDLNFEVFIVVTAQIVDLGIVRPFIGRLHACSLSDLTPYILTLNVRAMHFSGTWLFTCKTALCHNSQGHRHMVTRHCIQN
jgi:hypothetical protein